MSSLSTVPFSSNNFYEAVLKRINASSPTVSSFPLDTLPVITLNRLAQFATPSERYKLQRSAGFSLKIGERQELTKFPKCRLIKILRNTPPVIFPLIYSQVNPPNLTPMLKDNVLIRFTETVHFWFMNADDLSSPIFDHVIFEPTEVIFDGCTVSQDFLKACAKLMFGPLYELTIISPTYQENIKINDICVNFTDLKTLDIEISELTQNWAKSLDNVRTNSLVEVTLRGEIDELLAFKLKDLVSFISRQVIGFKLILGLDSMDQCQSEISLIEKALCAPHIFSTRKRPNPRTVVLKNYTSSVATFYYCGKLL